MTFLYGLYSLELTFFYMVHLFNSYYVVVTTYHKIITELNTKENIFI